MSVPTTRTEAAHDNAPSGTRTRGRGAKRAQASRLGSLPLLVLLAAFVVRPLGEVIGVAVTGPPTDLAPVTVGRLFVNTLGQASVSTVLALAVGVPVGWLLRDPALPGRRWLRTVCLVPFVLPTVVVVVAVRELYGPAGLITRLGVGPLAPIEGSWSGVVLAHVTFNVGVVVRLVSDRLASTDRHAIEAARVLGAGRFRVGTRVLWPATASAVGAAALVTFVLSATALGTVQLLGGPTRTTLETEVLYRTTQTGDLRGASMLGLATALVVALGGGVMWRWQGRRRVPMGREPRATGGVAAVARPSGRVRGVVDLRGQADHRRIARVLVAAGAVAVAAGAPIAVLVAGAFSTPRGWGFDNFGALGRQLRATSLAVDPWGAVVTSSLCAAGATILAILVLAPWCSRLRRTDRPQLMVAAFGVPWTVPTGLLGLGLVLLGGRWMGTPSGLAGVALAQGMVVLPVLAVLAGPAVLGVPQRLVEAAAVLGASRVRRFATVWWPSGGAAMGAAVALTFASAFGDYGVTQYVVPVERPTLPVLVARLLGRPVPGAVPRARALSLMLTVVCVAAFVVAERSGVPNRSRVRRRSARVTLGAQGDPNGEMPPTSL